jgi:hypothetical protein
MEFASWFQRVSVWDDMEMTWPDPRNLTLGSPMFYRAATAAVNGLDHFPAGVATVHSV